MQQKLFAIFIDDGYGLRRPGQLPRAYVAARSVFTARRAWRMRMAGSYVVERAFRVTLMGHNPEDADWDADEYLRTHAAARRI